MMKLNIPISHLFVFSMVACSLFTKDTLAQEVSLFAEGVKFESDTYLISKWTDEDDATISIDKSQNLVFFTQLYFGKNLMNMPMKLVRYEVGSIRVVNSNICDVDINSSTVIWMFNEQPINMDVRCSENENGSLINAEAQTTEGREFLFDMYRTFDGPIVVEVQIKNDKVKFMSTGTGFKTIWDDLKRPL